RADGCEAADVHVIPNTLEPAAAGDAHFVEEAPVAHGDIGHHAWRAIELRVSLPMGGGEVLDDVFRGPTAAGHDRRAGFQTKDFAVFGVDDGKRIGFCRVAVVPHRND